MLLIDTSGHVRSVLPQHAPVPYLRERFRHDANAVKHAFDRCRQDAAFIQALRDEMQQRLAWQPSAQHYPAAMIAAAMAAIADGLIDVAQTLPDGTLVQFDRQRPVEWDVRRTVAFADLPTVERFVASVLQSKQGLAAFEAVLLHPAGRRYGAGPQGIASAAADSRMAARSAALAQRAATLLLNRLLAIVPRDPALRQLWLVWMDHAPAYLPITADAPAAPPPPPPAAPPPQCTAPASTLPDAPDDLSPQAQALIDAAQDGVPFCEECARLAAQRAANG